MCTIRVLVYARAFIGALHASLYTRLLSLYTRQLLAATRQCHACCSLSGGGWRELFVAILSGLGVFLSSLCKSQELSNKVNLPVVCNESSKRAFCPNDCILEDYGLTGFLFYHSVITTMYERDGTTVHHK